MPDDVDDWETEEVETGDMFNCVQRWRNAGPEQHRKMVAMFLETGIFIAVCRHRFVLLVCDMIKSGELYVSSVPHLS